MPSATNNESVWLSTDKDFHPPEASKKSPTPGNSKNIKLPQKLNFW
jgi:hypothetical protein